MGQEETGLVCHFPVQWCAASAAAPSTRQKAAPAPLRHHASFPRGADASCLEIWEISSSYNFQRQKYSAEAIFSGVLSPSRGTEQFHSTPQLLFKDR